MNANAAPTASRVTPPATNTGVNPTLQRAFTAAGGKWSTFVIWAKSTFTLGRADYQRQYEPILYGWKEGSDHYW
jgi:hypothetical protein